MATDTITDTSLLDVLSRLEPGESLDQSLRMLLIKKVRNDLKKYRLMDQQFQQTYGSDFGTFRNSEDMKHPSAQTEQDYFDWEMSITLINELEDTLSKLQGHVA